MTYGLHFRFDPLHLQAFCDLDWAGSPSDRRSTSGFCVFLGLNPISWCAKKQNTVAHSSIDPKYRCVAHTTAELTWLCSLFCDLHIPLSTVHLIWCDNVSATWIQPSFSWLNKAYRSQLTLCSWKGGPQIAWGLICFLCGPPSWHIMNGLSSQRVHDP